MKLINKLVIKRRRQEGLALWLVVLIVAAAIGFVLWLTYVIVTHLLNHPIDPNHGVPDPEEDKAVSAWVKEMEAQYGPLHIELPEFGNASLPAQALAYDWYYTVETSTNLLDWTEVPLEWNQITNDLSKPVIFYRMVVRW